MKSRCIRGHFGDMFQGVLNRIFWNLEYFFVPMNASWQGCLTVGRDVTVVLSTRSQWKCLHIQKDASWAGDSPGVSLKTIGLSIFLLFDFWCYKIIIVSGPVSLEEPCPTKYKNPNCDKLFSCPTISKIPGTLSRYYDSGVFLFYHDQPTNTYGYYIHGFIFSQP